MRHWLTVMSLSVLFAASPVCVASANDGNKLDVQSEGTATVPQMHFQSVQPAKRVQSASQKLPTSQTSHLAIVMRLRNERKLEPFINSLYDKSSPMYGHYLTPGQFEAAFSPTQEQVQQVSNYLTSRGLKVTDVASNHLVIDVQGTPGQVDKVFGMVPNRVEMGNTVNDGAPVIPKAIAPLVDGVTGFDRQPMFANDITARPESTNTVPGYTPAQIQKAYNFTSTYANWRGRGQTIAIVTAGTLRTSDMQKFDTQFGLPDPSVQQVHASGFLFWPNEETTLDAEWSHAIAPSAAIQIYEVATPNDSSFIDAFNKVASDDTAHVVTTSWGGPENQISQSTIQSEHAIFQEMAAQGQSMFAASGDSGSSDGTSAAAVDYPSSDPYVTACGGTTLTLKSGTRLSETAWTGSGGGHSGYFGQPSWQYGPGLKWIAARQSADIALDADPHTGYQFVYKGSLQVGGGTSFVAPQMAATFALIDQERAAFGKAPIGLADSSIYALARSGSYASLAFYDITSGTNGQYQAKPGYDAPTGWGSINAGYFIKGLA